MSMLIPVLNAGYVELLDWMGGDKAIAEGARVCFQTEGNENSDKMLIKALIRKKHTSPLEHCTMRFKVKLPLFVRDHWVRHRIGMSYNIKSLRYCEANPEFFVPDEIIPGTREYEIWLADCKDIFNAYQGWMTHFEFICLKKNRARELARAYLPTGIYTEMLVTMNAASLIHFLDLRDNNHTQPETQLYAKALLKCAKYVAPVTFGCYEELKTSNQPCPTQKIINHLNEKFKSVKEDTSKTPGYEQLTFF